MDNVKDEGTKGIKEANKQRNKRKSPRRNPPPQQTVSALPLLLSLTAAAMHFLWTATRGPMLPKPDKKGNTTRGRKEMGVAVDVCAANRKYCYLFGQTGAGRKSESGDRGHQGHSKTFECSLCSFATTLVLFWFLFRIFLLFSLSVHVFL